MIYSLFCRSMILLQNEPYMITYIVYHTDVIVQILCKTSNNNKNGYRQFNVKLPFFHVKFAQIHTTVSTSYYFNHKITRSIIIIQLIIRLPITIKQLTL